MAKEIIAIDPKLAINLAAARAVLDTAQKALEQAESAIYLAVGDRIPEKGTIHVTGCKIVLGFYEKWNQIKLSEIENTWIRLSNLPFPFKREWKADSGMLKIVRENSPDGIKAIEEALTLTPRKPSFVLEI